MKQFAKSKVVFIVLISSILLCSCGSTDNTDNVTESETTSAINTEETESSSDNVEINGTEIDTEIPDIASDNFAEKLISFGFTEDEASENAEILRQCGIPTIDICEPTSSNSIDDIVSFRGKLDDDRIFIFTVDNRKIFYVSLNGEDLYDADNGGFLKKFDDVHIPEKSVTTEEFYTLRDETEAVLDKYFMDYRYYDAWGIGREDNIYMLSCQASDGSILTDNWFYCAVWYERQEDDSFKLTGVKINGRYYEVSN